MNKESYRVTIFESEFFKKYKICTPISLNYSSPFLRSGLDNKFFNLTSSQAFYFNKNYLICKRCETNITYNSYL